MADLNPQATQMADESMVRNLDAQARAIWPQEMSLFKAFATGTGTDLFIGRNIFGILAGMTLEEITVDHIVVDTLRTPRETFATIIEAWRDGYAQSIGDLTPITKESAVAYFNQMIANILDPAGYAVWMVPVVSARVPTF